MRSEALADLGRNDRALTATRLEGAADQLLRAPVAIDVGGVDEIDAAIERRIERGERILVVDRPPIGADRPAAKSDFAQVPSGAGDMSFVHASSPLRLGQRPQSPG